MAIEKNINITKYMLYFINILSTFLSSYVIYKGNELMAWKNLSRSFLEKLSYLPIEPKRFISYNFLLIFILLLSIYIRNKYFKKNRVLMTIFFILDMIICITSVALSGFSYKGILFIAVINLMVYWESSTIIYYLFSVILISYILLDYNILSTNIKIISLDTYIDFLDFDSRIYIYSFKSILNSLNQVLFIAFIGFSLQKQVKEKQRIEKLYIKLIDTTRELSVANKKLEDFAKTSQEMAKIQERNRLAREIHDTIGHSLTGIVTGLDACKTIIDIDLPSTKGQLFKIADLARKGLIDIRRSVKALRPDSLERFSLVSAINKMVEDMSSTTNIKIKLNIQGIFEALHADEEEAIFRTVQEGITNSIRHGNANEINIILKNLNNFIYLEIADNGIGTDSIKEDFGLLHIRERINMLAGKTRFESSINNGFKIFAEFNLRQK